MRGSFTNAILLLERELLAQNLIHYANNANSYCDHKDIHKYPWTQPKKQMRSIIDGKSMIP